MIGVISAHTEAPREFTQAEVDFLVTSASLVAGAIENARLYEEMRTRVRELETHRRAWPRRSRGRAPSRSSLPEVTARARDLLGARACHVYLLEPGSEELALPRLDAGGRAGARDRSGSSELGPELARGGRASRVAVPLVAGDELLGLLVGEGSASVDLARAVASQTAVGIKKIQLIERLTEKNLIKDFFEDLAAGRAGGDVEGRAARLGCDLEPPYLVLAAEPADDGLERGSRRAPAGLAVRPARRHASRAAARAAGGAGAGRRERAPRARRARASRRDRPLERLRRRRDLPRRVRGGAAGRCSARRCSSASASVLGFDDLGAYKYLLRIALEGGIRDATVEAVSRLADYDHAARRVAARDAGGVPAPARQHQRHLRGALRPPEHAAPAAAADR